MAITVPTLAELNQTVLAFYRARFPARDLGTESFLGKKAAAEAMMLYGFYKAAADADADALPSSLTSASRLDEFASTFGLSNGAGGFGRKGASGATGGAGTVTYAGSGPFPYTLADGTALTASDGTTQVELDGALVFASAGSMTGAFAATTTGIVGNLAVGQQLTFNSTISGLTPTVTLSTALSNGTDRETDADLLARLIDRLQNPPAGATAAQYRIWCNAQTNVHQTYVYPLRSGTGTVDMVIVGVGHGKDQRQPTTGTATLVQAFIDGVRPVAAEGSEVLRPYMPGAGHSIIAEVVATAGNESYVAGGSGLTVASHSGATITLSGAWAELNTAVNINGIHPHIQIFTTTTGGNLVANSAGQYVTEQRRVTGFNNSTHIATLQTAFTVAPTERRYRLLGGPVVETVSAAISAYVDALGPSQASGFAYQPATWSDTISIDRLVRSVCTPLDTVDGNRLCSNTVHVAGVPQVFIDGASSNVTAADSSPNAPELLWLKSVCVVQAP
jgi:uncharacterized phage protein gp47/JayE